MQPRTPTPATISNTGTQPCCREGYQLPSWKTTLFLPSQWNTPVNGLFNYFQTDMPAQYFITLVISLWKQRLYFASNTSCQKSTLTPFSGVKSVKWRHSLCSKKRTNQTELNCVHFKNHQCAVLIGMKLEWRFQSWIRAEQIYMSEVQPYVTSNKLCWSWQKLHISLFRKYDLTFLPIVATGGQEGSEVFYKRQLLGSFWLLIVPE